MSVTMVPANTRVDHMISMPLADFQRIVDRNCAMIDTLTELVDYFEDKADVVDGDYGQPEANYEMNMCTQIKILLGIVG